MISPENPTEKDRIPSPPPENDSEGQVELDPPSLSATQDVPGAEPEQPVSTEEKLEELKRQLSEKEQEAEWHKQQLSEKEQEAEWHKQQIEQLESQSARKKLLEEACQKDQNMTREDEQELRQYEQQIKRWLARGTMLREGTEGAIEKCLKQLLPACQTAKIELTEPLQEKLRERHQGMELIGRMVERLQEAIAKIETITLPEIDLIPFVHRQDLEALSSDCTDLAELKKAIDRKLKQVSNQRYQQVFALRTLEEEQRKQVLNFVKQKLLPVLDGIEEGQKHTRSLLEEIVQNEPAQQNTLEQWFKFYEDLCMEIRAVLESIGIKAMAVKRGDEADYIRHAPLLAEPDAELKTEQVKEVTQTGYEYSLEDGTSPQVLRPAQVIMVRN